MSEDACLLDVISIGCYLSPRMSVSAALQSGKYNDECNTKTKYREICCEEQLFPPLMALKAMQSCEHDKEDISALIYCHLHYQGGTFLWSPASYLSSKLYTSNRVACFNLSQGCNSLMIAIEQVCKTNSSQERYLLVASDRFNGTGFDRWNSDYGIVYGDGAISVLLGPRGEGKFAIEGLVTVWEPHLEALHRFDEVNSDTINKYYDIKGAKKNYLKLHGESKLKLSTLNSIESAINKLIEKTSVSISDIDYILLPHLGAGLIESSYFPPLGNMIDKVDLSFGQSTGHLGCSDTFAQLHALENDGKLRSGDTILAISAGAGFSWSACLLRKR